MRYKPTFSSQALFINRYLELTDSTLKYYGKHPKNVLNKQEPLFSIPLSQIIQASWVQV